MTTKEDSLEELTSLIRKYYNIESPIDIYVLVNKMNGHISYDCTMSEFDSPKIIKRTENTFEIIISPNKAKEMETFDIALSIGIIILSMNFLVDDTKWKLEICNVPYTPTTKEKLISEIFALKLLMPKEETITAFKDNTENNIVNTSVIAQSFSVTNNKAYQRMLELKLIEW